MTIAALAYPQLTAKTRQRVAALLQRNPDYAEWTRGFDESDRERIVFMRAATWPDAIKRKPNYSDEPEHGTTIISPNSGYRDPRLHRPWHYINTPISPDNTPAPAAGTPNLKTQLIALQQSLQSRATDIDTQSYDLVWLMHLVGDAHQPLHAVSRYTHDYPHGDEGGNALIICQQSCNQNLHSFWDGVLGKTRTPQTILRIISSYPRIDSRRAAILDPSAWLQESMDISQRVVYAPPVAISADPITLTGAYKANARLAAQQQAVVAGARLANLLNRLFGR